VLNSDPVDGSVLAEVPDTVSIVFSDDVTATDYHLSVGPARGGAPVSRGAPRLNGTELTVPVAITADGDYLATYHVVLVEGDVAAGTIRFAVGAGAAPGPAAATPGHTHDSGGPWNLALIVVDLVLVGAALLMLFRRPRGYAAPRKPWRLDPHGHGEVGEQDAGDSAFRSRVD
jgi:methionine-rich copper-binding protein CopC